MKGDGGIVKYLEKVCNFFHINDDIPLRLSFEKLKFINYGCCRQRWASTLANKSNARHRSNIRAPHALSPQMYVSKVWESVWPEGQDRKRFIASWGLRMSHICPCTPCPCPKGIGQRSKVVILPTTGCRTIQARKGEQAHS
jgi:hypothetical protein